MDCSVDIEERRVNLGISYKLGKVRTMYQSSIPWLQSLNEMKYAIVTFCLVPKSFLISSFLHQTNAFFPSFPWIYGHLSFYSRRNAKSSYIEKRSLAYKRADQTRRHQYFYTWRSKAILQITDDNGVEAGSTSEGEKYMQLEPIILENNRICRPSLHTERDSYGESKTMFYKAEEYCKLQVMLDNHSCLSDERFERPLTGFRGSGLDVFFECNSKWVESVGFACGRMIDVRLVRMGSWTATTASSLVQMRKTGQRQKHRER